ncbi:MAG: hypothetical protein FWG89_04185 [Treponema sp.]|nr:hypothetical protein [Treponema sp.]
MADILDDPYAGMETEEERQAIYQQLLAKYEQDDFERRKSIYTDLMENWNHQRSIQQDLDQRRHKYLFMLAGGSFGVSFAFISQVVMLESADNMVILVLSWLFFAITMIVAVLELTIGSFIQDMLLNNIEKNLERGYRGDPYKEPGRRLAMLPGRILGLVSVFSFIAGVLCLLYFVLQNT